MPQPPQPPSPPSPTTTEGETPSHKPVRRSRNEITISPVGYAMGALMGIAAALRMYALTFGMPQLVRPDEQFIITAQYFMLIGKTDSMPLWYPTLFQHLLFLFFGGTYLAGYLSGQYKQPTDYTLNTNIQQADWYLLARGLSALCGVLTLLPTYFLARRIRQSPWVGVLAAALLATAYLPVRDGHFAVTDQLATLTAMLTLAACVRYQESHSLRDALITGALLGVAFASKYTNITLIPLLLIAHFWGCPPNRRWGANLWLMAVAALVAAFTCAWEVFLHFGRVMHYMQMQSVNNGIFGEGLPIGWVYFLTFTLRYGLGVPLTLAALAGMFWTVRSRNVAALFALGFFLIYYGFNGAFPGVFSRHLNPVVPLLCLFAALGIYWCADVLRTRLGASASNLAVAALALLCIGPNLYSDAQMNRLLGETDTRVQVAAWIHQNIPATEQVAITKGSMFDLYDRDQELVVRLPSDGKSQDPEQAILPSTDAALRQRGVHFVVTSSYVSGIHYDTRRSLPATLQTDPNAHVLAVFSPFDPPESRPSPILEPHDAWYMPFVHFDGVARPGPVMTVWQLD